MKTKLLVFTIVSLLLLVIIPINSLAIETNYNKITIDLEFDRPTVKQVKIDDIFFDDIEISGCLSAGIYGEPILPKMKTNILIPMDEDVKNIEVTYDNKIHLGSGYNIRTEDANVPINKLSTSSESVNKNTITNTHKLYEKVGVFLYRGYKICVLNLNPVEYDQITGDLFYYPKLTVNVETIKVQSENFLRNVKKDKKQILDLVDNPSCISSYVNSYESGERSNILVTSASNNYDYLILTVDEFRDEFQRLADKHNSLGLNTKVKTLSDFGYSSVTHQIVREIIRQEYQNAIEYVLIGGDADIIPTINLYMFESMGSGQYVVGDVASDLYYACLDGTYNYDGDDKWGEKTDGENGGDVDLLAEVFIGRACVGEIQEAENFVDKTISYMSVNSNDQYLRKAAMFGEWFDYTSKVWGKDYLEELINGCNTNFHATVGIPSIDVYPDIGFNFGKVYDHEWEENGWIRPFPGGGGFPKTEVISRINDGVHIINHVGHASTSDNLKLTRSDMSKLNNDKYCFIYSQGCDSGNFNYEGGVRGPDCIAEYLTVKNPRGAFAGIWNTGFGWYNKNCTDGKSQRFHREFWDAIFSESSNDPDMKRLGVANQDSRDDLVHLINFPAMRWCYFELTLFGDPAVSLNVDSVNYNNNAPTRPEKPNGPTSGNTKTANNFTAVTTDIDGDNIYYIFDWGDESNSGWLGPYSSGEEVTAEYKWSKKGSYEVRVAACDEYNFQSDWSEPLDINIETKSKSLMRNFNLDNLFFKFIFQKIASISELIQ